jgi:hypothetical protein
VRIWILLLFACSSSSGGPDPCTRAFAKLSSLGMYGGDDYGALDAVSMGMACRDLTRDDLACLGAAKDQSGVADCVHAIAVTGAQKTLLASTGDEGPPPDTADVLALTDETCRCKDAACMVGVGERNREMLTRFAKSGKPDDPAALKALDKMRDCLAKLQGAPRAAAPATHDDLVGKMRFFADQMCACASADCARAVQATMTQWESHIDPSTKPDDATLKAVENESERLASCATKWPATP